MLCVQSPISRPAFNLAFEEYLLHAFSEDVFFMYRNEASFITGKHQIFPAEVNPQYALNHEIPVLRRISGGGTVYHDLGVLNFGLISRSLDHGLIDFKWFCGLLLKFIENFGVKAFFNERNSLMSGSYKIAGTAACIHQKSVMHHASLLVDAHLGIIQKALTPANSHYHHRAVHSVGSPVINLLDLPGNACSMEHVKEELLRFFNVCFPELQDYNLSEYDLTQINQREQKFLSVEWNQDQTLNYVFKNEWQEDNKLHSVELEVQKGRIQHAIWKENNKYTPDRVSWEKAFIGQYHEITTLKRVLNTLVPDAITLDYHIQHLF